MFRTRFILSAMVVSCLLLLTSCEGDPGPAGPQGPPGPGSRIVKSGLVSSAAETIDGQYISVPELDLSDFPLVAVYISDAADVWVQLNLTIYDPSSGTYIFFETAIIRDGSITIYSDMVGYPYRIVIVY